MGFIEEEDQNRLFRVADLWQGLEQFAQQPQQEGRIEFGALHQLVGGEDVHIATPLVVHLQEIVDVERGFAEEMVAALRFQLQQLALDRAHARLGDIAVAGRQRVGIFRAISEHGLKIAQVEQQQPFLIGIFEGDGQHAFLRFVKAHQPGEQQRPHFADGGTDRMALFAIKIPEDRRIIGIAIIGDAHFPGP